MAETMTVTNDAGRAFTVRVVLMGDTWGRDDCLTHEEPDPLVEWYDLTYVDKFGPRGQKVSYYYLSTLADHDPARGLALDGGVPAWTVSAGNVADAVAFAREVVARQEVADYLAGYVTRDDLSAGALAIVTEIDGS